uniref:Putative secreted peptide n=1 Tax=Anopheles braziliensis TaxID=58242 RepID=A0A2M3ZXU0_9DIPT
MRCLLLAFRFSRFFFSCSSISRSVLILCTSISRCLAKSTGCGAVMLLRWATGVSGAMELLEGDGRCILLVPRCTVSSTTSDALIRSTTFVWVSARTDVPLTFRIMSSGMRPARRAAPPGLTLSTNTGLSPDTFIP